MKPGTIVYQDISKTGKNIIFRYPVKTDLHLLLDYINTLSKEETFILWQGEQVTLVEEEKYLNLQLQKIAKRKAVQLLAFSDGKLVGNTQISLKDKAEKHIGVFGISLAKEFRGEGIGTTLMEKILQEAKTNLKDLKIISLSMFGNNHVAKKLYRKMGFVEFGNLPKGILHRGRPVDHLYLYKKI